MSGPPFGGGFGPGGPPAGYTGPTPAFVSSFLASISSAEGVAPTAATTTTTGSSAQQTNGAAGATISISLALGESTTAQLGWASAAGVQTTLVTSATSSPATTPISTPPAPPPGPAAASETLKQPSPPPPPALLGDGPNAHGASHSLSHGALGAVVAIPILFVLLALLAAFFCLRRRNKRRRNLAGSEAARMSGEHHNGGWAGAIREKLPFFSTTAGAAAVAAGSEKLAQHHERISSLDSDTNPPANPPAPIVTSTRPNRTYFSGLDTSSSVGESRGASGEYYSPDSVLGGMMPRRSEGGTFEEAPPPYRAKSLVSKGSRDSGSAQQGFGLGMGTLSVPVVHTRAPSESGMQLEGGDGGVGRSPFADPSSSPSMDNLAVAPLPVSRAGSHRSIGDSRSIDSDAYSDTASVHSARAARLSVCGIGGAGGVQVINRSSRDPFEDVSPIEGRGHVWDGDREEGGG